MVLEAYKGTISSVILSIVVIGILLVPFITANQLQKTRDGEGEYDFKETMCWDIDSEDDFYNDVDVESDCGEGALGYSYFKLYNSGVGYSLNYMTFSEYPINGTVNGYGMGTTVRCDDGGEVDFSYIHIFLTLTREDIIDLDITRIDIFFDIIGMDDCEYELWLWGGGENILEIGVVTVNETFQRKIDVDDMIKLYTFPEHSKITIMSTLQVEEGCTIQPGSIVIFDMQLYGIREMKLPSLSWLGIAMIGGGTFMIFCSMLMLPEISFSRVIDWLVKERGE